MQIFSTKCIQKIIKRYFWAFSLVILVLDVEFPFVSLFFKRYPKDIQKMRNLYIIKMGSFLLPYASSSIESIICIRIFSNSYSAILFVNNIDICNFHLSKKKSSSDEDDLPMGDVLAVRLNSHSWTTSRQYSHEPATNT